MAPLLHRMRYYIAKKKKMRRTIPIKRGDNAIIIYLVPTQHIVSLDSSAITTGSHKTALAW